MEYTNDVIFHVRYNEVKNKLEFEEEKWTSRFKNKLLKNKKIVLFLSACALLMAIDMILVYQFTNLLATL